MPHKKIKMRYPKATHSHTQAVLAFYKQGVAGARWLVEETKHWWVFRLRG